MNEPTRSGFSSGGAASTAAPRQASTVLLLRDRAGGGLEVLMVRRASKSSFMGGAYVFPGGKVDPADRPESFDIEPFEIERCAGALSPAAYGALDPADAFALHAAAIREVFEEAGVLLARDASGAAVTIDAAASERFGGYQAALARGEQTLPQILKAERLVPDLEALVPWAHWITPSAEPRRFDTRFFLARHPAAQVARIDREEATEQAWLSPAEALAAHDEARIMLPPPTLLNLIELAGFDGIEAAIEAARAREIGPILPKVIGLDETIAIVMPWDRAYAGAEGESLPLEGLHPMAQRISRVVLRGERWIAEEG